MGEGEGEPRWGARHAASGEVLGRRCKTEHTRRPQAPATHNAHRWFDPVVKRGRLVYTNTHTPAHPSQRCASPSSLRLRCSPALPRKRIALHSRTRSHALVTGAPTFVRAHACCTTKPHERGRRNPCTGRGSQKPLCSTFRLLCMALLTAGSASGPDAKRRCSLLHARLPHPTTHTLSPPQATGAAPLRCPRPAGIGRTPASCPRATLRAATPRARTAPASPRAARMRARATRAAHGAPPRPCLAAAR